MEKQLKILVAAGGTGGHLFPALAVVQQIEEKAEDTKFMFTGRSDKIEGELIPKRGYDFIPINVRGLGSIFSLDTFKLPFRIYNAFVKIKKVIQEEKIDAVLCAGAYISYAPAIAASKTGTPLFLMEANVNPGKSINMLSEKADRIFTSFDESTNYFPENVRKKIVITGNPVRKEILDIPEKKEAAERFNLDPEKPVVLIFGGSLGARSINNAAEKLVEKYRGKDVQIVWQTGKSYHGKEATNGNIQVHRFINDMASAYAAADLIICRSGATTVSELCITGKPAIMVPFPSASNDEQKINAEVLENHDAGVMIRDHEIAERIVEEVNKLLNNKKRLEVMGENAKALARPEAAAKAAENILEYLNKEQ